MQTSSHSRHGSARPYVIGYVLALVLTFIPFGLVGARALPPSWIFGAIAVTAIVQVVVHLRYFLHLDLRPSSQERVLALCFAAVMIVILAGGTLWIMFNLNGRMM